MKMKTQRGMNLIELMVALVLGLLVSAAAINVYIKTMQTQTENIQLMRLNQDLRATMDLVVRDIRRAGFATSTPETDFDCLKSNPFNDIGFFNAGTATAIAATNPASCIVFAYNRNNRQLNNVCGGAVQATDRFGYRINNGALEMKRSGGSEASCATGTWEDISGSDVTMTGSFTLNTKELDITEMFADADGVCNVGEACNVCDTGNQCLSIRDVIISLTGTLSDGTSQTITERVRVRNDEFDLIH